MLMITKAADESARRAGCNRDRGRAWYYQTWFVLMIVGMFGCDHSMAIIEPYFSDRLYFQGTVTSVRMDGDKKQVQAMVRACL